MKPLCPFWVNKVDALDVDSPSALTLSDILYCNVQDQDEVWSHVLLASYMIDINWIFRVVPSLLHIKEELLIVSGEKGYAKKFASSSSVYAGMKNGRVKVVEPNLPIPFGVHHSKFALCVNAKGIRVAVFTANLIPDDWTKKSQGIYVQDFPRIRYTSEKDMVNFLPGPSKDTRGCRFKNELYKYLDHYNVLFSASDHGGIPNTLLDQFDFAEASVELIASVPGYHRGPDAGSFGLGKIKKILQSMNFVPHQNNQPPILTWQFSSQGKLTDSFLTAFEDAMITEATTENQLKQSRPVVQVVYPTENEVKDSIEGWCGGLSLPLQLHCCHPCINERLHKWGQLAKNSCSTGTSRSRVLPHLKTYMRLTERKDGLKWFMLTSANLSRAAWGEWQKNGTQLAIRSYELGVVYDSSSFMKLSEKGLFTTTPSKPVPFPSFIEGDGLVEVYIEGGKNKEIQEGPALFLTYDPLNPDPYASTIQMRERGADFKNHPLSSHDIPWVVDIPHFGRDALGKEIHEAIGGDDTHDRVVDDNSDRKKTKTAAHWRKRDRQK
ncbi:tyrosyl-DNA Phosphodiesterase (Tdp1) [Trypanosoma grayi]|uniref:tyrosyl-DNA Phosphodiesterase (Tdp1) n=1 Tax=Trypanosoma grayi TaxID=71804 RepID=UPI0004F40D4E|nr:tyrosyl-DNA Phosphodiesterase (Tdp1) [Trypanosoma grayi]KEG07601.1 tyrosyl-DNA Phosphodiesterase (Tdp1) [Trypanosoma grayi]